MNLALLQLYVFVQGALGRLRDEERGQGLTEYALIIALIAVVVAVVVLTLGHQISNVFSNVTNCINAPTNTSC